MTMKTLCLLAMVILAAMLSGCAAHMTTYVPPSQQLVASEFYEVTIKASPEETYDKVVRAMSGFNWLQRSGTDLTYTGRVADASQYVDCGKILTHQPSPISSMNYASPQSEFMGMGPDSGSFDRLTTSLDIQVAINIVPAEDSSKVSVIVSYTLNREHVEMRTMFGIESRPPEKNTPIQFTTLNAGNAAYGVSCRSLFTLEYAIIQAIRAQ